MQKLLLAVMVLMTTGCGAGYWLNGPGFPSYGITPTEAQMAYGCNPETFTNMQTYYKGEIQRLSESSESHIAYMGYLFRPVPGENVCKVLASIGMPSRTDRVDTAGHTMYYWYYHQRSRYSVDAKLVTFERKNGQMIVESVVW